MLNILIADDNISYAVHLMNYINKQSYNIRVCNIAKNGKEALDILNGTDEIDIILLDFKMPIYDGKQVLEKIKDKDKYINSCIIISTEREALIELRNNNIVNSIINKAVNMNDIINKINTVVEYKEKLLEKENCINKIVQEMIYLGYDLSHKGTQYLIDTIHYIFLNRDTIINLEKYVYPNIAKSHNEKAYNIKYRINRETEFMYYNCKIEKLKEYFYLEDDIKPKIKRIISTIIHKIS